jgi:carnosine N-methyltransferase
MPLYQQSILHGEGIEFVYKTLNGLDIAIESNAEIAEKIFYHSIETFGIDTSALAEKEWLDSVTTEDHDKVRSTLKQFYRDWSAEGAAERAVCYTPVMEELERRFGSLAAKDKAKVQVLVPGAGLGRLAFDIAVAGYSAQGNENSYHQLMASNYILNYTTKKEQHTLYPFINSFSNHRTRENQMRGVKIPDVHPSTPLADAAHGDRFSMAAGDFVDSYSGTETAGAFNVVATVFFIDTAVNIFSYLETIWKCLCDGGVWINYGPLLWHWENREADLKLAGEDAQGMELTADEVVKVAEALGFKLEHREKGQKGEYIGAGEDSMLKWVYEGEFWVMTKVPKVTKYTR